MIQRRRPKRVLRVGAVIALLAAVQPAVAQEAPQAPDHRLTRVREALPAAAVEQIEASLADARIRGLPVEPLLDKAVEGIAKGVPGERIAGAVGTLARELGQARALLRDGATPPPADVAAVADALRRGIPEGTIRRMAERTGEGEPVALAVHTLGDLIERGVPADQALAVLEAWRERGARADELRELPAAVERLMRRGVLPAQAAAAVAGAMRQGGTPGMAGNPGKGPPTGPPIPPGAGPPTGRGKPDPKGKPPGGGSPPGGGG